MWEETQLSEIFDIGSAKRVLKAQWQSNGIPFYRGREITKLSSYGYVDNELFISEELYEEYKEKYGVPSAGDIVITAIGTIGNSYIVQDQDKFYYKDASVLCLRKKANVDSQFINYWLKSSLMKSQLDEGNGATVDTLTINKMKSLVVLLPPLEEQKRIVGILDEAFQGIDQAIKNTEQNLQNARDLFESYLNNIFTQKGEGWVDGVLGDFCNKVEYGTSAKSKPTGKIPVLRMGNIQDGCFVWDKLVYTDDPIEIDKYLLKKNDVLFNRTNSPELVGKSAIYKNETPAIFAGYLIRIHRIEDKIDADFLNYYLNCNLTRDYGKTVMSGSVNQANINGKKLKGYPISLPKDIEIQKEIIQRLDQIKTKTKQLETTYQQKLNALKELKQSILQKAFAGKLTTHDREVA